MKKTINIPLIPELECQDLGSEIMRTLESSGARCPIGSLNWPDIYPYHPLTVVNMAHSGQSLYIDFFVRCNYLRAVNWQNNSAVRDDSSVSILIQPPHSEDCYICIDFNCIGAKNARKIYRSGEVEPFSDEEIEKIECYTSCGPMPFREVEGLFTWDVAVKVPFELLGVEFYNKSVKLKGNLYKCALETTEPHFLTWIPVKEETTCFKDSNYFGNIILDN